MASMLLCVHTLPMVGLQMGLSAGQMSLLGSPSYSNLSTLPPSLGRTSAVSKLGGGMGNLSSFSPSFPRVSGVSKPGGMRIKKGARTVVRGSSNDGIRPSDVSAREEMVVERGASTSTGATFENFLDPSSPLLESNSQHNSVSSLDNIEERIERAIFDFRFLTLFGVVGSLLGAVLCFLKGCLFVTHSYHEYLRACFGVGGHTSRVVLYLVEAVDVYLIGTVMLIFGMGLYELFVSNLEVHGGNCRPMDDNRSTVCGSNLFGLFRLRQRPKWLEIHSLDELKTKLGHVIVMILLVGMFEKSKKVTVHTSMDFLCFSAAILLSSGALYLLSMLNKDPEH